MSKIPAHVIDDIMQASRIEEVIGDFVQLKKAGSNLKGLSPFNDEKTPSFVVSPSKQIFKCFSSGKGGTAVTFLMEMEQFSYPEALRWLANKYGIEVPEEKELTADELNLKNERDSLFVINEYASKYFKENLTNTKEGVNIGKSYFIERGYNEEIIEKFDLGYCLNAFDAFYKSAIEKKFNKDYLLKLGLIKESNDKVFDFFKGRVIFPIHSVTGRVLGFGGRVLGNDKNTAKYFNSPESAIYFKSKILYGLYFAKSEILKYDECFLCEGYTDVISLYQAGVKNVVSSSGTSLTKEQIRLLSRYTQNINILFDGDAAGIKASFRGIDMLLEEGMNVNVILFPNGEDPDSFSRKNTIDDLNKFLVNNKQNFISFKANILFQESEQNPIIKTKLIKEIVDSIALIPDSIARSIYIKDTAGRFEIKESILISEVQKRRNLKNVVQTSDETIFEAPAANTPFIQEINKTRFDYDQYIHEKELIRLLLRYGQQEVSFEGHDKELITTSIIELVVNELEVDELEMQHEMYKYIYTAFKTGLEQNILYSMNYFKSLEDQKVVKAVSDLEDLNAELSHNWLSKYNIYTKAESDNLYLTAMNLLYYFKLSVIQSKLGEVQKLLKNQEISDEDTLLLLSEQVNYEKIKKILTEKLGRTILK